MKRVQNIVVIVLSVICVGILAFLLWDLRSTEESAQEIIPEVQPEPMSEQSVSDSDVSGNSAENSGDPTELPETEECEPAEPVDLVEQKAEELLAGMTLEEKVGQMFIAREAGPELVGSFGSRAAVMNNNQIVESVSRGVYNAVRSAMGTGNSSYTFNITNQLDGREIGRQVIKYHNGVVKQTGMSPLLI